VWHGNVFGADETLTDLMFEVNGAIDEDREGRRPAQLVLHGVREAVLSTSGRSHHRHFVGIRGPISRTPAMRAEMTPLIILCVALLALFYMIKTATSGEFAAIVFTVISIVVSSSPISNADIFLWVPRNQ
jgi:hypothetical protein